MATGTISIEDGSRFEVEEDAGVKVEGTVALVEVPGYAEPQLAKPNNSGTPVYICFTMWFVDHFPKLCLNETFVVICDYFIRLYMLISDCLFASTIDWLFGLVYSAMKPFLCAYSWIMWLLVAPWVWICKFVLNILGIYPTLENLFNKCISNLDTLFNKLFIAIGVIYNYFSIKSGKLQEEAEEAMRLILAEAKTLLVTAVKIVKTVYSYWCELYSLVFPEQIRDRVTYYILNLALLCRKVYRIIRHCLIAVESVISLIEDTWSQPEGMATVVDIKRKPAGKDSAAPIKLGAPVATVATLSTVAESKART